MEVAKTLVKTELGRVANGRQMGSIPMLHDLLNSKNGKEVGRA